MRKSSKSTLNVKRPDGSVDREMLAQLLHATEAELVASIVRSSESGSRGSRLDSQDARLRLNLLVEILERVTPWAGNPRSAHEWYCSQPLSGFSGLTARELLICGRMSALHAHLDRIDAGGYA